MKQTKRLIALALVLVMALALMVPVMADDEPPTKNDSITINNAKVGETYKIYKMFDLQVDNENTPNGYS